MSTTAIAVLEPVAITPQRVMAPVRVLPLPWKDPATVSKADLVSYIASMERACELDPKSPDLRTCLGIAYAMNLEVYKSMDALEVAVALDSTHFFAQFKVSELFYRLRALPRAEKETLRAVDLAGNPWELSLAKKQLIDIRRLIREGTQKPEWNKSLKAPAILFAAMSVILCAMFLVTK